MRSIAGRSGAGYSLSPILIYVQSSIGVLVAVFASRYPHPEDLVPMNQPVKLLFICSRNQWRSPTAERLFDDFPGYAAKSAGTQKGSRVRVTAGLIGWADRIFVMEKRHAESLRRKFPEALRGKNPICLHISDRYRYMDAELIQLLQEKLEPYL